MRVISVIGSSTAKENSDEYMFAYRLGKLIGRKGFAVVCGGREGIMEAVCKGVKEEGGLTIGIMPSLTGEEANPYVDLKVNTGLGHLRNPIVVATGEIVVAISGNYGTLSEIAYSKIFGKTVLGYKTHNVEGVIQIYRPEDVFRYIK
ncbi:TIGR00725 family protein [Persephonella sp.]|uniref:TIGR00725 family protein n=1 Tax=Persephonella sp. TaxID=2060922 RepID=UPI0025DAD625|nr:TIGR00725 family protein [Persephonella sp.]